MADLNRQPNLCDPDAFYEALIALHQGRAPEESQRIDARLILTLANHIGDPEVLRQAMALAVSPLNPALGDAP